MKSKNIPTVRLWCDAGCHTAASVPLY